MLITDYYARPSVAKYGGVNASRNEFIQAFKKYSGFEIRLIDAKDGFISQRIPGVNRIVLKHIFNKHHVFMIPRNASKMIRQSDYLIMHEGWNAGNFYIALLCRLYKTPYFIIPHGVYDPSIVANLRLRIVRKKLEAFVLHGASFVNVFFESEREHILAIARDSTVVIAPTGSSELWERFKWEGGGNYVYYAGRIDDYHKGLDLLIRAWANIPTSNILVLQGQDFFGSMNRLNTLIESLNLNQKVILLPHTSHDEVMKKIENCLFFAHISRWESFGRSVVDSMSIGTPTLISTEMNLASIHDSKSVFEIVELTLESIQAGICNLLEKYNSSHPESIARINWIKKNFSWEDTILKILLAMKENL